jgi:type I restriction enzyme S subunit
MEEGRELPVGWAHAQVGELVDVGPKNECHDDTQVGFVPLQRLGVDYLSRHSHEPKAWKEVKKGYTHFQDGDVLLARITPSFENGKAGIARGLPNGIGAGSTEYIVCRPYSDAIDPRYLLAHFKTRSFLLDGEMVMTGAVGQQRVPKSFVFESTFPLAPLNEQHRIAAKLDTTLAAVDACRQRLDGVEALLKRFRQAVLAAATSGELTREWRNENRVFLDSWQAQTIAEISSQVFDGPFGSHLKSDDYTSDGYRVVRLENLSHLVFLEEKRTYISEAKFSSLQRHALIQGDILFSSFIDEEVRTCLLPSELSGISINKADCFCIRADTNSCLPEFLVGALSCRSAFEALGGLVHGATRPRINLKQLKSLSLQLPSIPEQQEIVRRTQSLFSLADQLEARLTAARKVVDRLTPALLAKAFRGELVPQDPGDEPASALLERIRAARQAEAAASGPSRRGRRPAAANPAPSPGDAAPVTPDRLANLLRECGALSERALLAASELDPASFQAQLAHERHLGAIGHVNDDGQELLEAVG